MPIKAENPDLFESGFSLILVSLSWLLTGDLAVDRYC